MILAIVYAQARFPVSSLKAQKKTNAKKTYIIENSINLVVLFRSLIFENIFISNTTFYKLSNFIVYHYSVVRNRSGANQQKLCVNV